MSAILKALKRVENETAGTRIPARPHYIHNRSAVTRRIKRFAERHRTATIFVTLCVLFVLGSMLFDPGPSTVVDSSSTAVLKRPSSTAARSAPKAKAAISKAPQPPAPPVSKAKKSARPGSLPSPSVTPPPVPKQKAAVSTEKKSSSPVVSAPAQTKAISLPVATVQSTGLALQALVWSPRPEERFAVINNRIVRENDQIDEAKVVAIENDFVVVETKGQRWQLKHHL